MKLKRFNQLNEGIHKSEDDGTYMVVNNLKQIKRDVETLLSLKDDPRFADMVTGEHAWAGDHITTSKDDIEEVANFVRGQFE